MHMLAIETSTGTAEVAIGQAGQPIQCVPLRADLRHGRDLVPCIERLLQGQGWRAADVQAVAVSQGPGSYTGLRVGLMCAKTLAYATGAHLVGVDSLQVVAAGSGDETGEVLVVADAQRGELYVARYRVETEAPVPLEPVHILTLADAVALAGRRALVLGPGLQRYRSDFVDAGCRLAPEDRWQPHAEWVLRLGWNRLQQGHVLDTHSAEPIYLRRPAAVDKWEATHGGP